MSDAPSIYSLTSDQAALEQFYVLYRSALAGRKYHAVKLHKFRTLSSACETLAAITASSSVASLAIWRTEVGGVIFTIFLALSAISSVVRSAFGFSESIDRHSRLAYAWSDLFVDMDLLISRIRSAGRLTDTARERLSDLAARFHRIEIQDEPQPDKELLDRVFEEANQAIPADRLWLPQS